VTVTDLRAQVESQTPLARPAYRADIQGLRALAVILVIAWHAGVTQARGGFIGVDVFFVISGYVITSLMRRQPRQSIGINLRAFYARRIRRIVPAATAVLIVTTIAAYVMSGQNLAANLIGDVRWSAFFGANYRLISTATPYPIPGVPSSLVTHFWSLAVEEQFYLVWPLIVFSILWFAPERRRTATLAGGLIAVIFGSAMWSAYVSPINHTSAFYSPFTRVWELALGALVSLIPATWAKRFPEGSAVLGWTALLAIIAAATTINYGGSWPGTLAWWPCLATAAVLVTGAAEHPLGPLKVLGTRTAQYIGDRSYSMYLWHYLWLMLLIDTGPVGANYSFWWLRVLEVAGAVLCAVISYRFLENPIRHSKLLDQDPTAVFIMLAVCLAATFATTYVVAHLANLT
jgi:peptidoglycan/LPS O-acetylase OafA/YrhL